MPVTISTKNLPRLFPIQSWRCIGYKEEQKRRFNLQPACSPIPPYDIIPLDSSSLSIYFSVLIKTEPLLSTARSYITYLSPSNGEKNQLATGTRSLQKGGLLFSLISTRLAFFGKRAKPGFWKQKEEKKERAYSSRRHSSRQPNFPRVPKSQFANHALPSILYQDTQTHKHRPILLSGFF